MSSSKRPKNTILNCFAKVSKTTNISEVKDKMKEQNFIENALDTEGIASTSSSFERLSDNCSDTDIGLFVGIHLDDNQRLRLIENVWKPNSSFCFPANEKNRRFQYRWFEKYPWLSYSAKFDGAFCKTCVAFSKREGGQGSQRLGNLVLTPFKQWKNALECFTSHQLCQYHKNSNIACEEFLKIMKGQQQNVGILLHNRRNEEIEKNRLKLISIIRAVILCGRQGLSLRGHRDSGNISVEGTNKNKGNFRAFLKFAAESGDENLKDGRNGEISSKYTSPDIQNEIIEACGQIIQSQIVARINAAKCFAVLADGTTDISGKEILSLCIRYVDESNVSYIIREDFLDFIEIESSTGVAISEVIISRLKKLGIDISYIRGQGYDGASNMSGRLNGVQAKILEEHPNALYVHCSNHVLNLVLSKSCTIPSIRNSLSTIQEIVTFFRASAKRRNMLKNTLQEEGHLSKRKNKCLKSFCETRWVERHEALFIFCEYLDSIVSTLLKIHQDVNSDSETSKKAMLFYNSLCESTFLVSVFVAEKCFSITHNLSIALQKPDTDLVSAYNSINEVTQLLIKMRENSQVAFSAIFKRIDETARELDFEITKPRYAKKQVYRVNIPSDSVEDYYHKTIFIPFLDFLIKNMIDRFENHKNIIISLNDILPKNIEKSSMENILQCAAFYSEDINILPKLLEGEIQMWTNKWMSTDIKERPNTVLETLSKCDATIYPNIKKMLKILTTLPISTATPERTFSTLRRLKTYLRSTMSNSRLSGLALLNIYEEMSINPDFILNKMSAKRSYLVL